MIPIARGGIEEWTRLVVDPSGVSRGAYGLYRSGIDEIQAVRSVDIALPDVSASWNLLIFGQEGPNFRLDANLRLRNEGPGRSKAAAIGFYFSDDATLDEGDTALAFHKSAPALAPGQTKDMKISFLVPAPHPAKHLLVVVDPQARLDDLDRLNNTLAVDLTGLPQ
jgi:CARDB protein